MDRRCSDRAGRILRDDAVLLHITGNDDTLVRRDFPLHRIDPVVTLRPGDVTEATLVRLRETILP